jgi:hypothetical protein
MDAADLPLHAFVFTLHFASNSEIWAAEGLVDGR